MLIDDAWVDSEVETSFRLVVNRLRTCQAGETIDNE